jgi:hypothetical protein
LQIANVGSSVPPGVVQLLDEILVSMTHVDYRKRPASLSWVRSRLWSAIKLLQNELAYQKRLQRTRELKEARRINALNKDARFAARKQIEGNVC